MGNDREHVMAKADIFQKPDSVLIQITANGEEGKYLADFLTATIPVGISVIPIAYRDIKEKRDNI